MEVLSLQLAVLSMLDGLCRETILMSETQQLRDRLVVEKFCRVIGVEALVERLLLVVVHGSRLVFMH